MSARLFTIPAGAPFAESLARGLVARLGGGPLDLSRCIIFLPTRRAARGFGEAFAKLLSGAALLPQFRALGDSEEDDLLFDTASEGVDLPPAITPIRRQMLLAALIRRWRPMPFAQAAQMADSLAAVMDEMERQGADLAALDGLAPAALAAHWQAVTDFLGLVRDHWPAILAAENRMNPAARQNAALALLAERLTRAPPEGMVIAAGSTGSIPASARLIGAIAALPNGAVVLPGLDREMDDKSWNDLDPGHPQFGLKQLLGGVGVPRTAVSDWDGGDTNAQRRTLLRETLRPAPTTDAWRALAESGGGVIARGLEGLSLIAANDPAEEALVIALALRHALETEGRTAALVTPDRSLARRVAAELGRWDVAIDDSAGRPLAHTGAGAFLCLLAEAAEAGFAPVPLLALLKHPFAGGNPAHFRGLVRLLDKYALRGPRPDPGLQGIAAAIARARSEARPLTGLTRWWQDIAARLKPLEDAFAAKTVALGDLVRTHLAVAEDLCGARDTPLWRGPEGEAAAALFDALLEAAEGLPQIEPAAWPGLLRTLAMKVPVRPQFGRRRAIAILGPLEARLQSFDLTILGGLNEGTWPAGAPADPWFSRPMRKELGLEQPERRIGLAAHDFATLAAGREVLLTRALKAGGAPTIAARWLQRLTQLTDGLGLGEHLAPRTDYLAMARALSAVAPAPRMARPAPRPPVAARPRGLSVTEIETWLRDPYAIYARHVLKLRPLEALDEAAGPLERGSALHKALEDFIRDYPGALPDDAVLQLMARADRAFAALGVPKAALVLWRPRFLSAAQWFVAYERRRRADIASSHLEVRGARVFPAPGGDFTLRGIADRIDILKNGDAAILDYKTGKPPSGPQIEQLLTPQLPLEAAILEAGGFPGIEARKVEDLIYLRLSGGANGNADQPLADVAALTARATEQLARRIALFDDAATAYPSRVRPFSADSVGDYDHLARVREWSASGWSEVP